MKQKFQKYDLVRVAVNHSPTRSHFKSDCDAIIISSYAEEYGGDDTNSYTICIEDYGYTSWYREEHLTLLKKGQEELLKKWETDAKSKEE